MMNRQRGEAVVATKVPEGLGSDSLLFFKPCENARALLPLLQPMMRC
jgi:hypothetical protein